jgi:hypothetical protein
MRRKGVAFLAGLGLMATSVVVPASLGSPKPPTNGGNGAGQSGQCTGKAADRPASCQSP